MRSVPQAIYSVLASGVLVAVFSILGRESWQDYRTFEDHPRQTDLAGAVSASASGRQWVTIQDAPWRCEEEIRDGHTYFPARSIDGAEVVARFDHDVACKDASAVPLTGIIEPMERDDLDRLKADGLILGPPGEVRILSVCAFCGKDNARTGVLVCGFFILLGLGLYPLRLGLGALYGWYVGTLHGALHGPPSTEARAVRTLRAVGLLLLLIAGLCFTVGQGYVLDRILPVPWFGGIALMIGALYLVFPQQMRALAARTRRR